MSTGGSVAIPVRSLATAAKSSAIALASALAAGLTVNSAIGPCSHPRTPRADLEAADFISRRSLVRVESGLRCRIQMPSQTPRHALRRAGPRWPDYPSPRYSRDILLPYPAAPCMIRPLAASQL